jgi:hypothetical protein
MGIGWQIVVALLVGELVGAVCLLVAAARVRPDEPAARFRSGWLGTFGLLLGLVGGTGLAAVLAEFGTASVAGVAAAVALNVVLQPVGLLFCWTGVRKIALGVRGRVAYAWRLVPEAELADLPPADRRGLARFCVLQGVIALLFGAAISIGVASPLVHWFIAEPSAAADRRGM